MKKTYLTPSFEVIKMYMQDAVLGNAISGNGTSTFGDAEEGGEEEEGDVKGRYNVWNDDWSN